MIITAGKFKGQKLKVPDEKITRPTLSKVRMGIFNTLQSIINFDNATFLDMYAGSGIMGLEALSRGFNYVVSIEKNKKAFNIIKSNYEQICSSKLSSFKIISGDSLYIIKSAKMNFDVVYIDPPYFSGIYEKSLEAVKHISSIIILEHVIDVNFEGFELIKQKKYGDKFITFLKPI